MKYKQYVYIRSLLEMLNRDKKSFEKLELEKESMSDEDADRNIKSLLKRIKDRK